MKKILFMVGKGTVTPPNPLDPPAKMTILSVGDSNLPPIKMTIINADESTN